VTKHTAPACAAHQVDGNARKPCRHHGCVLLLLLVLAGVGCLGWTPDRRLHAAA
jgi:hypothetical protein